MDMQAATRISTARTSGSRRRARHPHTSPRSLRPEDLFEGPFANALADTQSARREGPTRDDAFYPCGCGTAFYAAVSTTVACPACGAGQDW